ncbi:MAG: asparagine synthase (glutamine-hydrolyzing), partial [Patescibacteria group bacterium]|nr:asparagine synthase (glutamine-hydrolyzing) [Patescibacteria group bacterium]
MCGIAGIYQNQKIYNKKDLEATVGKMNTSQKNRGPDDEGIFIDKKNGAALGHCRLSILDLSEAGKQPMSFGDLVITFNGEIYNFLELRKNLEEKGYKFKTQTDTEVILALYAEYGEKSFSMLRGMFAFGLWDAAKQKLFLVKDRYGIKPLYYFADEEKIIFTSTIRAIKESGMAKLTENKDAKIYFLAFGSIPGPYTTHNEILSIKPGYFLEIGSDGQIEEKKYYDSFTPFLKKINDSRETAVKKIKEILRESVKLHLISDAPLGVFLSGGLDSSTLAALSAKALREGGIDKKITTLSIIFDEPEFSEQKYQQAVVDKIKSDHREIKITKNDFEKSFNEIFEAMDQPTIDGVNTYFVSKAAKEAGLKAVLSGLGSDEIFMGYHYFRIVKYVRLAQRLIPNLIFNLLPKGGKWGKLQWLKEKHPFFSYIALRGIFYCKSCAEILKIGENEVWTAVKKILNILPEEKELRKLSAQDLQSYFDLNFYMANQLLKDTDFMSMAHSIEIRVPFLDHVLVEYLSGLPDKLKLCGEYPKQLLIDAISVG